MFHIWERSALYFRIMSLQVTPILAELREGNLVGNLDALTASASLAAADIHQLQNDVSTFSGCAYILGR